MIEKDDCKQKGLLIPRIDRNKCEGKADCERVCPYDVFDMGKLDEAQRAELSSPGRIKSFFHGYKQAFATRATECHGCGLCVTACPEKAITLVRA